MIKLNHLLTLTISVLAQKFWDFCADWYEITWKAFDEILTIFAKCNNKRQANMQIKQLHQLNNFNNCIENKNTIVKTLNHMCSLDDTFQMWESYFYWFK